MEPKKIVMLAVVVIVVILALELFLFPLSPAPSPAPEIEEENQTQEKTSNISTPTVGEGQEDEGEANKSTHTTQPEENQETRTQPPSIEVNSFTTNKNTYGSNEKVEILLTLDSSRQAENVTVRVQGIKPYNTYYLTAEKTVQLSAGANQLTLEATTPSCTSGCGGVNPGSYQLQAKVFWNETLLSNSSETINLVSS